LDEALRGDSIAQFIGRAVSMHKCSISVLLLSSGEATLITNDYT